MKPEHEHILPDVDAFDDFCDILYLHNLHRIQEVWDKKGVAIERRLVDPKDMDAPQPFSLTEYDATRSGDYLAYPITKVWLQVSIEALIVAHPEPLPDVLVWFAHACLRYRATCNTEGYFKALYRVLRTPEMQGWIRSAIVDRYVTPLLQLPYLRIAFSTKEIMLYVQMEPEAFKSAIEATGLPFAGPMQNITAVRIREGMPAVEYDAHGQPNRQVAGIEELTERVFVELRRRKLQLLIAE